MIVVRDVFQLKFGKAKEAKALLKEGMAIATRLGYGSFRALTDLVGPFYTLVLESTFASLADYETRLKSTLGQKEWSDWYQKFLPIAEGGRREIFTVVE